MSDLCVVRVARVPGLVKEVALNGSRTVRAAAEIAGVQTDGSIHVNGRVGNLDTTLSNGDRVTISKGAKGNS
jgi:hypothetical protein